MANQVSITLRAVYPWWFVLVVYVPIMLNLDSIVDWLFDLAHEHKIIKFERVA